MRNHEDFRHDVADCLNGIVRGRRGTCAARTSGEDLKVMARCVQIAGTAPALSPHLCAAVEETLGDPIRARHFARLWADLPEAMGTTIWPKDATELVSWMVRFAHPAS